MCLHHHHHPHHGCHHGQCPSCTWHGVRLLIVVALALQLLPLSFNEQQLPDNICSFCHMQPAGEILHGHGVEVHEHLDCHRDLSQFLWDHTQDLLNYAIVLHVLTELTQAGDKSVDADCKLVDELLITKDNILKLVQETLYICRLHMVITNPLRFHSLPRLFH
jgi:hypothetical protein